MNYAEHNRNTLKEALGRLPEYEPPGSLWRQIDAELERQQRERPLQEALHQLPSYSPPPAVWERIESGLEPPRPRVRLRRLAWVAAAACIAALLALRVLFLSDGSSPQPVYTYEMERASIGMFANNWDSDEEALSTIVSQFTHDPVAKTRSQYEDILEEWQELEEAKAEIKEIMGLYGRDARLIRQMSEIERERSRLARAMAMAI